MFWHLDAAKGDCHLLHLTDVRVAANSDNLFSLLSQKINVMIFSILQLIGDQSSLLKVRRRIET